MDRNTSFNVDNRSRQNRILLEPPVEAMPLRMTIDRLTRALNNPPFQPQYQARSFANVLFRNQRLEESKEESKEEVKRNIREEEKKREADMDVDSNPSIEDTNNSEEVIDTR